MISLKNKSLKLKEEIEAYLKSFQTICPNATIEELNYLESGLSVVELKAKHFFIHANTIQKEIGFLYSGLLRAFYIDNNGNEISVNFIRENRYATHYSAFITRTPSKYYFQCLEPTVLVTISYKHIQEGYEKFQIFERYGRLVAESVLKIQQKRIEGFLFDNAESRYLDFINENPDLFNRVSLSYLASYLGIERQSLTRIRKKLAGHSI
jgi:CRP/FNR family transcriptional regulator